MSLLSGYQTWRLPTILLIALAVVGCGSSDNEPLQPSRFAVLSAFPGELAPHLEQAVIHDAVDLDGRVVRLGSLHGVPVVLALTGIGLVNASTTTRALLDRFDVQGIIVSAVAGSERLRIGDVAVPAAWEAMDGTTYRAHPEWVEEAHRIAASGTVSLENCTMVPSVSDEPVCLPHKPAIVVGGVGESSDPFRGQPFPCWPRGGDVFGCDVDTVAASTARVGGRTKGAPASFATEEPDVSDMETAAIAREAAERGLPFIAFRAVSDGQGDPLGLPEFPAQFFAYYSLAARNAAAATSAFWDRIAAGTPRQRRGTPGHD